MKKIKNESGRSMVEMLGVLAVMGLLTIIGIAGFKIAMNKAKANNLVADMNRLAHIVVMDKFSGYSADAINRDVMEHNQKAEYQAEYQTKTSQIFALSTKMPVDKDLCQQVINLEWKIPVATLINRVSKEKFSESDCTDENTITWAFTNDLSPCPGCPLTQIPCGLYGTECGSCNDVQGFVPKDSECQEEGKPYCVNGHCTECPEGQWWYSLKNSCPVCTSNHSSTQNTSASSKSACPGIMVGFGEHSLIGCDYPSAKIFSADELSCRQCTSRCFFNADNSCRLLSSTAGQIRNEDGTCSECQKGYWRYTNGHVCVACNIDYGGTANVARATVNNCLKQMFFGNSRIYGCNYTVDNVGGADETSCKECPSRCYLNGKCYFYGEGYTYPYKDKYGNCSNTAHSE